MAELLLELLSEEIPARMQPRAADALRQLLTERLNGAGLTYTDAETYVTPRRLAVVVEGLPSRQPDLVEERKGPRVGAPDKALEGFMRANGLGSIEEAEVRASDKGEFYFAVRQVAGRATCEVLPGLIVETIRAMPWPKSMRWGEGAFRWVRPLHAILAVFDGKPLEGALPLGAEAALAFGDRTVGHRFLAPGPIQATCFADYRDALLAAKVVLDPAERRRRIMAAAERLASEVGLAVKDDPGLLDEVVGLVEWPVVLIGEIDAAFMELPPEVLTTAMRVHQKYFTLLDANGRPANRFLVVANTETAGAGAAVVTGNERVLRARLSDARFFWDQDCKVSLASRTTALADIVFHAKLGSLDHKVDRIQALAVAIAGQVPGADKDRVRSAARLAKADLTTGMVGEFPELQGIMGRYYALHDREHPEVARAIAEHYAPQGPRDRCPSEPVSVAVALADKIDSLVGFFAIGELPTGSKDPYALRRAALGVIRLIVENELRLPLRPLFDTALGALSLKLENAFVQAASRAGKAIQPGRSRADRPFGPSRQDDTIEQLMDFFAERVKVALKDKGVRHDLVSAVFALGDEDDLLRLLQRVRALESFLASDDGANLLVAYRRAANIVRIEEKKDKASYQGPVEAALLAQDEERVLHLALGEALEAAALALENEDFTATMSALARLRGPVDRFFDKVTVNADDPRLRENRLRLLARIGATLGEVADFSRIEG